MQEDNVLFCLPIQDGQLEAFKAFIADCRKNKLTEWMDMLARYDMSSVKVWYKNIEGKDYALVFHDIGPEFAEKIKVWGNSDHPFDHWFSEQLNTYYAVEATSEPALSLAQLYV